MTKNSRSSGAGDAFIGSKVRARRMELKISQEELGDALGVSFQQVQKYEKGTNRVAGARIAHLAKVLSVPESYFFEGMPTTGRSLSKNASVDLSRVLIDREGVKLCEAFLKLDAIERTAICDLAIKLAGKRKRPAAQ